MLLGMLGLRVGVRVIGMSMCSGTVYREYGSSSGVLRLLGSWLLLVTGGGPTDDKPTVTFAPPDDADRVSSELIFRVPDCRGSYQVLRQRGAQFLTPPVDSGYEIRAFLRNPDGHLFEISEVPGQPGGD